MSTCYFCGEPAHETLAEGAVCVDCYLRLRTIPDEDRRAYLIGSLQKVHGTVLSMRTDSPYRGWWLDKLARRLAHAQGLPAPEQAKSAPTRKKKLKIRKL